MIDQVIKAFDLTTAEVLLVSTPDSTIRHASSALLAKWNCQLPDIIGKQIMNSGVGLVSAKPTTLGLSQHDKNQLEISYSPPTGNQNQSVFSVQPIVYDSETYILLLGVPDSSEEHQPDIATERRLNLALRSGGYALWDHNFETGETYNSPEMVHIFGRQVGDQPLNYQSFETLVHPDDKEKSINTKILEAPIETEVFQTRSRIKTGTGKYAWIETVASLVRDQTTGKPKKCVGLCRNIDHEMLTMERLKNSELMLKRTQAVSHIGSFKLRIESGVSRLTAELAAMIGLADAMVHPNLDTFIKMVEPNDREKLLEGIELAKIGKPIRNLEIAVKSQKGNLEWFAVTLEPERNANGSLESIFGACQLITERKSLEDRFQQAQKMEAVGQLTGGIAHDFNNLLMVVMGNLQLVEKLVASDDKATKRIRAAMEAAEKGSDLTRRMLAFSRQQTLQNRDILLNDMINAMQDMLRQAITAAVELHVIPNAEVWPVKADKTMLETAILNLAINARDAMAKNNGGKLIIETANRTLDAGYSDNNEEIKPGDYVEIAVTDTGSGIAPENLSKVFQPFFTTKGPEAGSGLGLSMIYGFVKQSGGHVKIYSEVGVGTSVKLYLPRNKSLSVSAPIAIETAPPTIDSTTSTVAPKKLKILIVEDNSSVRDVAAAMIEEMGFETLTACNGHEGLAAIEAMPDLDMVLSDVIMAGGMNGPELAAKAIKLRPDLKILFMSGYAPGSMRQMQDLPDEIELVNKPFTRADLTEKVKRTLSRVAPLPAAA